MKETAKKLLRPAYAAAQRLLRNTIAIDQVDRDSASQQMQRSIVNQYLGFKAQGIAPYSKIQDAGFRVYSQFEEDGIILYILSIIGFKTKRVVEMCCGTGDECMATNLILNHGFEGCLFDGDQGHIRKAEAFFKSKQECLLYTPVLKQAWITADNINDLLIQSGAEGEVDVFSLDIDGNDYWVWNAISAINPRLLVFETHNIIPASRSITIKYQPDFQCWNKPPDEQDYRGVSLLAMQKLCRRRGYRLIGGHRFGFNVFFLRDDEGTRFFPEVTIAEVHDNHFTRLAQKERWPVVKDMPWQEV